MVHDTPPFKEAFTHQIWNSYLKEYRRYAPKLMSILETRSAVKVTLQGWYATLYQRKMHLHKKIRIPPSIVIRIILQTGSEVKVTVIRNWNTTLRHHKILTLTKFGIPTSNNVRDMPRTLLF